MTASLRSILMTCALSLLSGCSTTPYISAVSTFSDGATKVNSAIDKLVTTERDTISTNAEFVVIDNGYALTVSPNCNAPKEPPDEKTPLDFKGINCGAAYQQKGKPPQDIVPSKAGPHAMELAAKLDAYGKALLILAQAKDVAEVKDAANKAAAAVASLATTVGGPFGPAVGAGVSLVAWIYGEYEDQLRLQKLKEVAGNANSLVAKGAMLLKRDAQELTRNIFQLDSIALTGDTTEFALNRAKLSRDVAKQRIDAILASSNQLQDMKDAKLEEPFDSMAASHAKLVAALNDPNVKISDVLATLNDFLTKAEALETALSPKKGGK